MMSAPSRSPGSSSTSGNCRWHDLTECAACDGDEGLSAQVDSSSDETELEYRRWPRAEKVGVTGEPTSDEEEFVM